MNLGIQKYIVAVAVFAGVFLLARYLLPIFLPFALGAGLAIAAEPVVRFFSQRLRLKRSLATAIGITLVFLLLTMVILLLCGLLLRELRNLAGILPELEVTLRAGMDTADHWLTNLAGQIPGELGPVLTRNVNSFFSDGSALLSRAANFLLKLASGVLSHVPGSALGVGTGIISSFMISAKLQKIRIWLQAQSASAQLEPVLSAVAQLKTSLLGWLRAQAKLSAVTYLLALAGLLLLKVPYSPLWALTVSLVDAFPILGTGTVLLPWSIVSFLQGDRFLAFGLLGLYAVIALVRSLLEPRLLGKHLGLDPLVTLIALYTGYRLWGIGGMILAPMLAVAVTQLMAPGWQEP